jgi:hypothetical protein
MPWANYKDIPQALKTAGLTLPQANVWAKYFDQGEAADMKAPGGFAWTRFKQEYKKEGDKWTRKEKPTQKSEIEIPYVMKDEVLLREGEANGIFYSAEEIKLSIPYLQEEIHEGDDPEIRHKNSVFCDHDDLEEGTWKWVGHFENPRWDESEKVLRADLYIADERIAKLISYQKNQGIMRFGISPRLSIKEDGAKASQIQFKGVSLVIFPAGGPQLMLEKDGKFTATSPFFKMDEEKRIVYGVVLEPYYVDSQGDWFDEEEIENAMYKFMEEYQILTIQHQDRMGRQTPVMTDELSKDWESHWNLSIAESYRAPVDFELFDQKIRKGSWVMAVKVHDDKEWQRVKKSGLTGFSIGGMAL